jgi:hypothetical protein
MPAGVGPQHTASEGEVKRWKHHKEYESVVMLSSVGVGEVEARRDKKQES